MAAAANELIVLPPVGHGLYPVVSGDKVYHVDPATGECDCRGWVFRCSYTHNLCKHGRAVKAHLEAALGCPFCHGAGWLIPSGLITYVRPDGSKDTEPAACVMCSGSGRRGEDEEMFR